MLLAACLVLGTGLGPADAQKALSGTVIGKQEPRFGRMIFTFPEPVVARVSTLGGVMVVLFDRPVTIPLDMLSRLLPDYVGAARMDPDGRSLRLALVQPLVADLKDAAEQFYLDLLPAGWRGPAPPLPPAVVEELARRARTMRETVREIEARKAAPVPWPLRLHVAETEERTRLVLAMPPRTTAVLHKRGQGVEVVLNGPVLLEPEAIRSALAGRVDGVSVYAEEAGGRIGFVAPEGQSVELIEEDGFVYIDLIRPPPPVPPAVAEAVVSEPEPIAGTGGKALPADPTAEAAPSGVPDIVGGPVRVLLEAAGEGVAITVSPALPAVVFDRGGLVHLVLAGAGPVTVEAKGAAPERLVASLAQSAIDEASLVTLRPLTPGRLAVARTGEGWRITIGTGDAAALPPLVFARVDAANGEGALMARAVAVRPVTLAETDQAGLPLIVVPVGGTGQALAKRQRFVGLGLVPSALGAVIAPEAEDVRVEVSAGGIRISRNGGLALSERVRPAAERTPEPEPQFAAAQWNDDRRGAIRETERTLLAAAAAAPRYARTAARLRLAEFHLANGHANEASGVLTVIGRDDPGAGQNRQVMLARLIAAVMRDDRAHASKLAADPVLAGDPEARLWRGYLDAMTGRHAQAVLAFRTGARLMDRLPDVQQALLRPAAIGAALGTGDSYLAGQHLGDFERLDEGVRDPMLVTLLSGRVAEAAGRKSEAQTAFKLASTARNRAIESEARLEHALLGLATGTLERKTAKAELETLAVIWRRGEVELKARARLADLYSEDMDWRDAFLQSRRAQEIQPEHPITRAMHDSAVKTFSALFLEGRDTKLSKVQALAILTEFRSLIPSGARGDEIVGRLAERLYALDLIDQAADLYAHQVKHRLKGTARLRAATRLAMLHLENRKPREALQALGGTRAAQMPDDLRRARLLIEARALSENGREPLALDLIAGEADADAERLRGDIHWGAGRWDEAAVAYERALGARWTEDTPLEPGERADLIRAGLSYALSGDRLSLDRLRSRYFARLDEGPDAETFGAITSDPLSGPDGFRRLAGRAAALGTFDAFLAAYRKRYPDVAGVARAKDGGPGG